MDEFFTALGVLVAALGGGAFIVAVCSAWLGKLWADRMMVRERAKIDQTMADIKMSHEKALAALNSQLKRTEIQFSKLHEKRAEVVAEIYQSLIQLLAAAQIHLAAKGLNQELLKYYIKSKNDFNELIEKNRIYFSRRLYDMLDGFWRKLESGSISKSCISGTPWPQDGVEKQERLETLIQNFDLAYRDAPALRDLLITEFHQLLGVTEDSKNPSP